MDDQQIAGRVIGFFIVSILLALFGKDRKIGYWWSLAACAFLSPIIGLFIIFNSPKKEDEPSNKPSGPASSRDTGDIRRIDDGIEYGSLRQELLTKCNPKNFMANYHAETVDIAIDLYAQIKGTSPNDEEGLKKLRTIARDKLGVRCNTKKIFNKVASMVNPANPAYQDKTPEFQKAMNSYYNQARQAANDIDVLEAIENEVRAKYGKELPGYIIPGPPENDNTDSWIIFIATLLVVTIIVTILIIAAYH